MIKQNIVNQFGYGLVAIRVLADYTDLQATSGSGAKLINVTDAAGNVVQVPVNAKIISVNAQTITPFSGGSLSAMTVSLGKSGSVTYFTATYDVFAAVSDTNLQETPGLFKHGQKTALTLTLNFTPTGDNCSAATAGQVAYDILMWVPSTPLS